MTWHLSIAMIAEIESLCVNSPCSQGRGAESSAQGCLDGESCAQLKSSRIAEKSSFDGKKKGTSNRSPSGTMCEPSTAARGVEKWMLSLGDSPVSHSAQPEKTSDEMTPATCGLTHSGSYAKWDHDSACWKTYQTCLLTNTTEKLSGVYRRAGIACGGELYPQPNWERRIGEIGSGLLPTPGAWDGVKSVAFTIPQIVKHQEKGTHATKMIYELLAMGVDLSDIPKMYESAMLWVKGWTDLKPLETDKFQQWLEQHGIFYQENKNE